MKSITFIFILTFINFLNAQDNYEIKRKENPIGKINTFTFNPQNNTSLSYQSDSVDKVFHLDALISNGFFGSNGPNTTGLIRITEDELENYVGQEINAIRFGFGTGASEVVSARVLIYEGFPDNSPDHAESIDLNFNELTWNTRLLTNGYTIPADTFIYFGIEIISTQTDFPLTFDSNDGNPNHPEDYNLFLIGNTFQPFFGDDFNIHALITDGTDALTSDLFIESVSTENCSPSSQHNVNVQLRNIGEIEISNSFNLTVEIEGQIETIEVEPNNFLPGTGLMVSLGTFALETIGSFDTVVSFDFQDTYTFNNDYQGSTLIGDATITVDIRPDVIFMSGWQILDENGVVIADFETHGPYSSNVQTISDVCVNQNGCYIIRVFDDFGQDGFSGTGNIPPGEFSIFYNGDLIGQSPADGNFGAEFIIEEVGECNLLAVNTNSLSSLSYYPNPVSNVLNLNYEDSISSIIIYNLSGQELINKIVNSKNTSIDLSDFSNGTYIMRVNSQNNFEMYQLIKE